MSNRTLVELNHDYCPRNDDVSLLAWAKAMRLYMGSGEKEHLPRGVTFKHIRHHSQPDPMQGGREAPDKQTASPALLAALQRAVDLYGKPGGPWNVPGDPGGWIAQAREAIAEATGNTV